MRYINQDYVKTKLVECAGNEYYQIGANEWNITVGLGRLIKIANKAKKIIEEYVGRLDKED